jgi:enoyl-CoA hydratase/carnithine racemase
MTAFRHPDDGRIVTRRQGNVLVIAIDRPKKLNGFSAVMLDELGAAYSEMERDPEVRCGLLCAEGRNFTAGLELSKLSERFAAGKPLFPENEVDPVNLHRLRTKPLVAAVQGICFTIGIELMLAADVVIAATDCRFAQLEVQRGIMASAGATIRIPERAGLGNALRYLLTGDEFGAETALRMGLVQEVVMPEELHAHAMALATRIAAQAPLAVSATLSNARKAIFEGPSLASKEISALQAKLRTTEDSTEGVRSFIEKRPGRFVGR